MHKGDSFTTSSPVHSLTDSNGKLKQCCRWYEAMLQATNGPAQAYFEARPHACVICDAFWMSVPAKDPVCVPALSRCQHVTNSFIAVGTHSQGLFCQQKQTELDNVLMWELLGNSHGRHCTRVDMWCHRSAADGIVNCSYIDWHRPWTGLIFHWKRVFCNMFCSLNWLILISECPN